MLCFPLDNVEYEAKALGAWCGTRTRGVFASDGHYAVTANGNMTVTVSPGLAWLKADTYWGVNAFETNPTVLPIETADGSLPRIDAVCIRLDKNLGTAALIVKKGAYSPQPPGIPVILRDLDYDEIYVATIRVRNGATSILASDITDRRTDENYCGIMRDGVTGIPTQVLYDQWMAWFESIKGILDEEAAGHLLLMIEAAQADADAAQGTADAAQTAASGAQGTANAALAAANKALVSNGNLLINADFDNGLPVLNNGASAAPECWLFYGSSTTKTIAVGSAGATLTSQGGSGYVSLYQYIEFLGDVLAGKTLSLSVNVGGTVYRVSGILSTSYVKVDFPGGYARFSRRSADNSMINVECVINANASVTVKWVHLGVGNGDVNHVPDNPQMNLLKTMRYYQVLDTNACGMQYCFAQGKISGPRFLTPMRQTPTLTFGLIVEFVSYTAVTPSGTMGANQNGIQYIDLIQQIAPSSSGYMFAGGIRANARIT